MKEKEALCGLGPSAYEILFLPKEGKFPLKIIIALCDDDLPAMYYRWLYERDEEGFSQEVLEQEIYPALARLVVSWNSRRFCTEKEVVRLIGGQALAVLHAATRLTEGKEITEGELLCNCLLSAVPLQ